MNMKKIVLVLAPHTDDGEFGCGGSIARFIEKGDRVYYVAFSSADKSVPSHLPKDILKHEVREATAALGIEQDSLILFDFEVRNFLAYRQAILEEMVQLNTELKPDLVLLPCPNDTHQDHQVIAQEGFRAFKKTSMLGYELPWNTLQFSSVSFMVLKEVHMAKKITALQCYRSQADRSYANEIFIRSLAITRGTQIGTQFAESFEAIRWIMS